MNTLTDKLFSIGTGARQTITMVVIVLSAGVFLSACNSQTMASLESAAEEAASENSDGSTIDGGSGESADTPPDSDAASQSAQSGTSETEVADAKEELKGPTIIRKPSTVTQKGTNIEAIVNGRPITNYDVKRRAAFLRLRRVGGDRNEKALEELVDEEIKMQEARRLGVVPSNSEVDESFERFAKSNRMTTAQLGQVLGQAGVGADHFKSFIRGQISWNRAVGTKFRSETVQKTQQEALFEIRKSGSERPETTEYLLQQVIFVIPESKRKALLPQRRKEAYAFKQNFTTCDTTAQKASALLDVTVRNLPRTLEPRLPEEWSEQIVATEAGKTTEIKNTDRGVEFIAVCSRKTVSDDNAVTVIEQAEDFENFNERGDEIANEFLAELKSRAKIIYR